jgi:phosphate transport system substrate-binding protein
MKRDSLQFSKEALMRLFIAALVLFTALAPRVSGQEAKLKGSISLSGAWAIYPTAVSWGEAFHKKFPDVKVNVSAGGAGKGATDVMAGLVDIGMVSRDPDSSELTKGIVPIYILHDAVFPVISERNPSRDILIKKGIKKSALTDIFVDGAAKVASWKQLDAALSDKPVHVYTRSDACGAAASWAKFLNKKQEDLKGIGIYGDPGILEAVIRDPVGIGYVNFSFVFTKAGSLVTGACLLPIDANDNGVADSNETFKDRSCAIKAIESKSYPAARKNYFYTKGSPKGLVRDFIEFVLSDDGTRIVESVGASLALPGEERKKVLSTLR